MDVLCELYPVEMTAIFVSKRIFAATGGARTAELPILCGMFSFPWHRHQIIGANSLLSHSNDTRKVE